MATIKAIEGRSIHQIQSGQVIVDLSSVVKELVENSLDAGAKFIEIRFKNHGLDSIEVQDNGKGIAPQDFDSIALKHYTSKLSSYEDLTSLDTFGFRGEALSSLCALSKFHIVTARAEDGAVGKRLDFETSGKLKAVSVTAAQKGTTVYVENLFLNLPVRRKELEKNVKREYGKVLSYMYAYACISVGVRFIVSNQMPKGKKMSVFSTEPNTTTKDNITNIFGAKTLAALVKLDLELEMTPSDGSDVRLSRKRSIEASGQSLKVSVEGHISRPVFGEGRQTPDRQMFFVNSRPCQLPQVSKAFNEVYKCFNVSQSPFIFANIVMDTNAYDVNVSPDKRTILLHDQTALLDSLKSALTRMFENTEHTVPQSTLPNRKSSYQPVKVLRQQSSGSAGMRNMTEEQRQQSEDGDQEETDNSPSSDDNEGERGVLEERTDAALPNFIQEWAERKVDERKEAPVRKRLGGVLDLQTSGLLDRMRQNDEVPVAEPATSLFVSPSPTATDKSDSGSGNVLYRHRTLNANQGVTIDEDSDSAEGPNITGYRGDDTFANPANTKTKQQEQERGNSKQQIESFGFSPAHNPDKNPWTSEHAVEDNTAADDQQITAFAPSSHKSVPGAVQNAFDRMRPKRAPLQTAEITIGDETITTIIGSSPLHKKRRIHQPESSQTVARFGGSPRHAHGLCKSFAAPGSQLDFDSSQTAPEESVAEELDDSDQAQLSEDGHESDTSAMKEPTLFLASSESSAPDDLRSAVTGDDEEDGDYIDENAKKTQEDERIATMIHDAEESAVRPNAEVLKRVSHSLKRNGNRKDTTLSLTTSLSVALDDIKRQAALQSGAAEPSTWDLEAGANAVVKDDIDSAEAEKRLSLIVSKEDFEQMQVVGQFNLGFILAMRPAVDTDQEDDLFIIDQHAADEKYNFERLQHTVTLTNQRLVHPKALELTAFEQEVILNHPEALKANGFEIDHASDADDAEGGEERTFRLLTLPTSQQTTFTLSDLEELIHLLSEAGSTKESHHIPRPSKVQKMLAMRACRSSIMVGKTLTAKQMIKVVRNMGEMEKPWNCPHGRPTMRHLARMGTWRGWQEGDQMVDFVHPAEEDDEGSITMEQTPFDWGKWIDGQ